MDCALDFAPIRGIPTACCRVVGADDFDNFSRVRVFDEIFAFNDLPVSEAHLFAGSQAEVLWGRFFTKIILLDVDHLENGSFRVPAEGSSGLLIASNSSVLPSG